MDEAGLRRRSGVQLKGYHSMSRLMQLSRLLQNEWNSVLCFSFSCHPSVSANSL